MAHLGPLALRAGLAGLNAGIVHLGSKLELLLQSVVLGQAEVTLDLV